MVIRAEQITAFEVAAWKQFEEEMVVHSRGFSPELCKVIGDEQLRLALRSAITRAESYGFTYRGPIRLLIEMMFLFGSAFDTDPQYAVVGEILRSSGDQMLRAEQIHGGQLEYLEAVCGSDAMNERKAQRDLLILAQTPVTFSPNDLIAGLRQQMTDIFPQKVAYVGEAGITTLIRDGIAEARRNGFQTARQAALLVMLKFEFGHGRADRRACTVFPDFGVVVFLWWLTVAAVSHLGCSRGGLWVGHAAAADARARNCKSEDWRPGERNHPARDRGSEDGVVGAHETPL